jgi:xylan 1,4-beta-xylosidase
MEDFLTHVTEGANYATGEHGTPVDFVSFHAKGSPSVVDGHVRMGIAAQLATIDEAFRMIAARPALKDKPIIIGESDPEGCAACQGPRLGYRNGTMYSSYTAASFARKYELAAKHRVHLEGALTWAFEFEDQPYFAGFRQLNSGGLNLPVMNVFRMFSLLQGRQVAAQSSAQIALEKIIRDGVRTAPDIGVLATRSDHRVAALVWHYHDDDVPGPDAAVHLSIAGLQRHFNDARLSHYRIDEQHSNAYAAWRRMGAPIAPSKAQYDELQAAGELQMLAPATPIQIRKGRADINFVLPRQGVSLLIIEAHQ